MANIKPVILVNMTDGDLEFTPSKIETAFHKVMIVDEKTGQPTPVEQAYEIRKPDSERSVTVSPSLDRGQRGARPGYAVLKLSTYRALTDEKTGVPGFERVWANQRDGFVEVLEGPSAIKFIEAWDVDVAKEAV